MLIAEHNPVPDLIELKLRLAPHADNSQHVELRAELRINSGEIETDRTPITVTLKKVLLKLEVAGLELVPGTRFGEPVRENKLVEKHLKSKASEINADASASLSFTASQTPTAGGKASLGAGGSYKNSASVESTEEACKYRVTARGNNSWEIAEIDGEDLKDTYLNDDVLCVLSKAKGANLSSLSAFMVAKERDLRIDIDSFIGRMTTTQKSLLGIFIAKCIEGGDYKGFVQLARSEFEVD